MLEVTYYLCDREREKEREKEGEGERGRKETGRESERKGRGGRRGERKEKEIQDLMTMGNCRCCLLEDHDCDDMYLPITSWLKEYMCKVTGDFLGAGYMENFRRRSDKILKKRSSRLHQESFSQGSKIPCNRTKKFQIGLRRRLTHARRCKLATTNSCWVHFRFQFQPGLKFSHVISPLEFYPL